jgi:hypothetical protein
MFSVFIDIGRVVIPFCALLYSNAKFYVMHNYWGSYPIFFRTLSLCFYHNIFWSLSSVSCWKTNLFILVLCAIVEKSRGISFFVGTLPSWEFCYLISCTIYYLLEWDKPMSMCALYIFYAHWFCLVHMLNFVCVHVLIWFFDIIWTILCSVTLLCAFLVYLVLCPDCIFFWFLKVLCMHIYYMFILWHPFFLWSNI